MDKSTIQTPLEVANEFKSKGLVDSVISFSNGNATINDERAKFLIEKIIQSTEWDAHEGVFIKCDLETECFYIIAIHSTQRGQPIGGVRFCEYPHFEDAINDVLGLSKGMTMKTAMAQMWVGGGKAVIVPFTTTASKNFYVGAGNTLDEMGVQRKTILRGYAKFASSLKGLFVSGKDANLHTWDMEYMLRYNVHTCCLDSNVGGAGSVSEVTAKGVYEGIKTAWNSTQKTQFEKGGQSVLIKGLGEVGIVIAEHCLLDGNIIYVYEPRSERISALRKKINSTNISEVSNYSEFIRIEADVFSPNALSGSLTLDTIEQLKVKLIAGAENAQIAKGDENSITSILEKKGILYLPEIMTNFMGVYMAWLERVGVSTNSINAKIVSIGETTKHLIRLAEKNECTVFEEAQRYIQKSLSEEHPIKEISSLYSEIIMEAFCSRIGAPRKNQLQIN